MKIDVTCPHGIKLKIERDRDGKNTYCYDVDGECAQCDLDSGEVVGDMWRAHRPRVAFVFPRICQAGYVVAVNDAGASWCNRQVADYREVLIDSGCCEDADDEDMPWEATVEFEAGDQVQFGKEELQGWIHTAEDDPDVETTFYDYPGYYCGLSAGYRGTVDWNRVEHDLLAAAVDWREPNEAYRESLVRQGVEVPPS